VAGNENYSHKYLLQAVRNCSNHPRQTLEKLILIPFCDDLFFVIGTLHWRNQTGVYINYFLTYIWVPKRIKCCGFITNMSLITYDNIEKSTHSAIFIYLVFCNSSLTNVTQFCNDKAENTISELTSASLL
jgi:hypothetical protein